MFELIRRGLVQLILHDRSSPEMNSARAQTSAQQGNSTVAHAHLAEARSRMTQGRWDEAEALLRKSVDADDSLVDAYGALAEIFWRQGRFLESTAMSHQVASRDPRDAMARFHLGDGLMQLGDFDEAVAAFRASIALKADYAPAHVRLSVALERLGRYEDSAAAASRAVAIDASSPAARFRLAFLRRSVCDWREFASDAVFIRRSIRDGAGFFPGAISLMPATAAEQLRNARDFVAGLDLPPPMPIVSRESRSDVRIRLGYLSSGLREHPTGRLIAELIELHDRKRFEVLGYSLARDDGSRLGARIAQAFDRIAYIQDGSQAEFAARIRDDEVDILVDLNGHTDGNGIRILARRPAPIQVNYLGYPGTMGAAFIDYLIADKIVVPESDQDSYSEKLAYLPHSYQVNDRRRPIGEPTPARAELGLPEHGLVFACLNDPRKIVPEFFDLWVRLLAAVPDSVLWLMGGRDAAARNLRREAERRGVAESRLVWAPRLPAPEHLARVRRADLFLDTLPCGGHTTLSDTLWAGVPAVTCLGDAFPGRVGASLLRAVGLPELVTESLAEYEALALRLARDPSRLAELRRRLHTNREMAPLFDTPRFVRHIEAAYEEMWRNWRAQRPPRPIIVRETP